MERMCTFVDALCTFVKDYTTFVPPRFFRSLCSEHSEVSEISEHSEYSEYSTKLMTEKYQRAICAGAHGKDK